MLNFLIPWVLVMFSKYWEKIPAFNTGLNLFIFSSPEHIVFRELGPNGTLVLCFICFYTQGMTFYVTPSVQPPISDLRKVIESAGGTILKRGLPIKAIENLKDDQVV